MPTGLLLKPFEHIRSLEDGEFEIFAAPVYIRGFVRSYGTLLKLDVPLLLAQLDEELSQIEKFSEARNITGEPRTPLDWVMFQLSRLKWRVALPIVLGLALLMLSVWAVRARRQRAAAADPLANLGPGLYQPAHSNSGELLPLPTNVHGLKPK